MFDEREREGERERERERGILGPTPSRMVWSENRDRFSIEFYLILNAMFFPQLPRGLDGVWTSLSIGYEGVPLALGDMCYLFGCYDYTVIWFDENSTKHVQSFMFSINETSCVIGELCETFLSLG